VVAAGEERAASREAGRGTVSGRCDGGEAFWALGERRGRGRERARARAAARSGEWKATRRSPVVWTVLGGVGGAVSPAGVRKAAVGVGHGAAHLLLLVADARKAPGVRAVQEQGGGDEEQGANAALSRSTTCSEENDSRALN